MPSDLELIEAISRGDAGALEALFKRHAPVLMALAYRVVRDRHEAEDVVGEVFWEVWHRRDRYMKTRGSPKTYLVLVTRSRASIAWRFSNSRSVSSRR